MQKHQLTILLLTIITISTLSSFADNTNFETKLAKSIFQQQTTRTNTLLINQKYNFSFDAPPHYLIVKDTYESELFKPYTFIAYGKSTRQHVRTDKQIKIAIYTLNNTTWKKLLKSHPTKKLKRTHTNQYTYITETYQKNKTQRTYTKTALYKNQPLLIKYNSPTEYKYYVKDLNMIMNTLKFT